MGRFSIVGTLCKGLKAKEDKYRVYNSALPRKDRNNHFSYQINSPARIIIRTEWIRVII